jgi:hypothetical protein
MDTTKKQQLRTKVLVHLTLKQKNNMKYQDYIDLDFKRIDISDEVSFERTGYKGFILTKKLRKGVDIEVCSDNLDQPRLYIEKKDHDIECFILRLNKEQVIELLT